MTVALVVALVMIAGVLGYIRYNSAAWTAKQFIDTLYSRDYTSAINLVCADASSVKNSILLTEAFTGALLPIAVDASNFTYSIQSESLTAATVAVSGTASAYGIVSAPTSGTISLESSGLSWCVERTS